MSQGVQSLWKSRIKFSTCRRRISGTDSDRSRQTNGYGSLHAVSSCQPSRGVVGTRVKYHIPNPLHVWRLHCLYSLAWGFRLDCWYKNDDIVINGFCSSEATTTIQGRDGIDRSTHLFDVWIGGRCLQVVSGGSCICADHLVCHLTTLRFAIVVDGSSCAETGGV